jgi:hypothetical protein
MIHLIYLILKLSTGKGCRERYGEASVFGPSTSKDSIVVYELQIRNYESPIVFKNRTFKLRIANCKLYLRIANSKLRMPIVFKNRTSKLRIANSELRIAKLRIANSNLRIESQVVKSQIVNLIRNCPELQTNGILTCARKTQIF